MIKLISNALLALLIVSPAFSLAKVNALSIKDAATTHTAPNRKVKGFFYTVRNGDKEQTISYMVDGKLTTLKPGEINFHYSDNMFAVISVDKTTGDEKFVPITGDINAATSNLVLYSNYGIVRGFTVAK